MDYRLLDTVMARLLADAQREMDLLHATWGGRPAGEVDLAIRVTMARAGWDLDDDVVWELDDDVVWEYAELIQAGVRVEL